MTFKDVPQPLGTATLGHGSGRLAVLESPRCQPQHHRGYGGNVNFNGSSSESVTQSVSTPVVPPLNPNPPSSGDVPGGSTGGNYTNGIMADRIAKAKQTILARFEGVKDETDLFARQQQEQREEQAAQDGRTA